jgi:beta-glucosidase
VATYRTLAARSRELYENGDFYLSNAEKILVEKVKALFPKVVIVLNVGGVVDTEWFVDDDRVQSVLLAWQGGMVGGEAAAELLCGIGTPSGKLADTFAKRLEDYPSTAGFHESDTYVDYTEDIYVGYRYFETLPGAAEKVN